MFYSTHSGASERWIRFLWSSCFLFWNKPAFQTQPCFYVLLFDETKWTTSKRTCSLSLGLLFSFTFICKLTQYSGSLWSQKVRDCLIFRLRKMADNSLSVPSKAWSPLIATSLKECVASGDKPNKRKRMSLLFPSIHLSRFLWAHSGQSVSTWDWNNLPVPFSLVRAQCVCWCDSVHQSDNLLKRCSWKNTRLFY